MRGPGRLTISNGFPVQMTTTRFHWLSNLCSFCTISSGLRVQFRHLLANLRKIYIHDVNIDASQADRALNGTARNQ